MTVNRKLLDETIDWAEAEFAKGIRLSRWYQTAYFLNAVEDPISRDPECGTCYCIAGKITQDLHPEASMLEEESRSDSIYILDSVEYNRFGAYQTAMEALGIDEEWADRLFDPWNTIEDLRRIAAEIYAWEEEWAEALNA